MSDSDKFDRLLDRLGSLLARVETLVPGSVDEVDFAATVAFRWRKTLGAGHLEGVADLHDIDLDDLQHIGRQKRELDRNTRQFVAGLPANNALLWGSRGTGKSSLIKALINAHAPAGLRVIEVDRHDLIDLPDIVDALHGRSERFIIFSDDLSFEADDPSYKALKAILDGSVHAPPDNVLIYATSNRRHLMPEYMRDNLDARPVDGEIHQSEAVEEKISLSERFGLWLSFYPFKQDQYLEIVAHWIQSLNGAALDPEAVRGEALKWALGRGSRSGRSAYQFARDWVGRHGLAGG